MDVAHRFAPSNEPGKIACPFCQGAIVLEPIKIVRGEAIACPHCDATLTVDRAASAEALGLLEKAMARADATGKAPAPPDTLGKRGRGRRGRPARSRDRKAP